MKKILVYCSLLMLVCLSSFAQNEKSAGSHEANAWYSNTDTTKLHVSNAEWKKILSADLYAVSREKDTERPFTGKYWEKHNPGHLLLRGLRQPAVQVGCQVCKQLRLAQLLRAKPDNSCSLSYR